MCTVGQNDITCYSAVNTMDFEIFSDFTLYCEDTFYYNGDLDECSNQCRQVVIRMSYYLACCVRLVYGIPATSATYGYADEVIWDACQVPLPSEDCFAQTGGVIAIATGLGTAALMILLASYF